MSGYPYQVHEFPKLALIISGGVAASRRDTGCNNEEYLSSDLRIKEKYEETAKRI
jgi:hypothetical protein